MEKIPSAITPPHPTNLPIITHLIATYKLWHEFLPHIPKDSRYTLGAKVDRSLANAAELLFIASYLERDRKAPYLQKANADLDLAKFFLQILWEVNALDNKKYVILSEKFAEVGRMLGGWIKGLEHKPPAHQREV
ncbi:MAG: four helix bundle protein [Candidatus Pacebacteria bacterium]|nr:four helix bundle protein [Candidatus Paceibacterota bacterium]